MTKTLKKNTLTKTLLVSGTVLTCGMAAMSQSNVHIPNAHALGVNAKINKLNTIQPAHFESSYQVPADALPVKFVWTPGKTSVEGKTTGFTTATQGTNGQQVWAPANRPHSPMPLYDTDMHSGNKIRIKNAGYVVGPDGSSNSGQWIDLICEPNNEWNSNHPHPFHTGTAIGDSSTIGDKPDNNHSITFLTTGADNNGIQWQITPVKAGTDQKVKIGTIAYWSDIDVFQGISETFSNDQVYWANTAGYLHDSGVLPKLWNNRFVYSNNQFDGQGMLDVDKTGYVGTGAGDGFRLTFASPFVKAGDTNGAGNDQGIKINGIGIWDFCPAYRYDVFGNFPNLKLTPPPTNHFKNPQKTVTDMDENKVKDNTLSLKERNYKYDITGDTEAGAFKQLVMTDTLPDKVSTNAGSVHVYNKAGKDVTGDFDINVQGQKVTATLKNEQKSNGDLQNTTLDFQINATSAVQGLGQVQNQATINDGNGDLKTNQVNTITPPPPSVTKQVSVDNGKTFANADTPQTAAQMTSGNQDYTWRNNFKLSSYTNFKKIVFTDHMENIQDVNLSNVHVYDWDGKDVTNRGKLTTAKTSNSKQTDIVWTANSDYLNSVNERFGNKSNETPTFHMDITTNFKNASQAQKQGYWNDQLKRVIIPNKTTLIEGDNSGDVQTDSNPSHVTPPPSVTKITKSVTDMDEKNVTDNSLSLKERNYQYDIKADTYGAGKFQKLVMTDTLPNGVSTKASDIHIINKAGKDVTGDFDINVQGQNVTVSLKGDQLSNGDVENTTLDYQIKVASSLKGVAKADNTSTITDGDHNLTSNRVETITPPPPSVTKQVSVDGGKTFVAADTPQTAAALASRPQDYTWRNNFKLSSYTNFTKIVFTDHMENLQKVDLSKVHVYDWQGKDVTAQGKLTTAKNGDKQTNVVWTANPDYIKSVNAAFGNKSDKVPTFHMDITTNIKDATDAQEAGYYNKDLKKVIIPNQTNLIEGDNSGDVSTDSNKSHVTPPKPNAPTVTKQVAVEGTDPTKDAGWNKTLELNNHDQEYEYRTKFVLSKNFNFDGGNLILTDHFENFQKYGSIKILDAQGKDISSDFTITTKKTSATGTDIVATVKNETANKYDDAGNTIYMVLDHVTWKGATGAQEAKYMEHKEDLKDDETTKENAPKAISKSVGSMSSSVSSKASSASSTVTATSAKSQASVSADADPFKVGITVPNQSELVEHSAIPGYSFDTKTQHTYVNFDIQSRIHKYVEDDNDSDTIVDPSGRALKVPEKIVDSKVANDKKADSAKDDKASSKSSSVSSASNSSAKAQVSSKVTANSLK